MADILEPNAVYPVSDVVGPVQDAQTPQRPRAATASATHTQSPVQANWTQVFEPPWDSLPKEILKALQKGEKLVPKQRRTLVRIVSDKIMQITRKPGRKALEQIAYKMTGKYPASLKDYIGETLVGSGYDSLVRSMENRIDNQTRGETPSARKRTQDKLGEGEKPVERDPYGCIEWLPREFPHEENEESQKDHMEWLKEHNLLPPNQFKLAEITRRMKATYRSQRIDIVEKCLSTKDLRANWPYLFEFQWLLTHFHILVGIDLQTTIVKHLQEKAPKILAYMKATCKAKKSDTEVKQACESSGSDIPKTTGCVLMLLEYFKEEREKLILCVEVH